MGAFLLAIAAIGDSRLFVPGVGRAVGPAVNRGLQPFDSRRAASAQYAQPAVLAAARTRRSWGALRRGVRMGASDALEEAPMDSMRLALARKDPITVYVVLRKDLEWPAGAMINQACHACIAMARDATAAGDKMYQLYVAESEGQMNQATMGVKDEVALRKLMKRMDDKGLRYAPWIEQPEGLLVGFASWPQRRTLLQKALKGLQRF